MPKPEFNSVLRRQKPIPVLWIISFKFRKAKKNQTANSCVSQANANIETAFWPLPASHLERSAKTNEETREEISPTAESQWAICVNYCLNCIGSNAKSKLSILVATTYNEAWRANTKSQSEFWSIVAESNANTNTEIEYCQI